MYKLDISQIMCLQAQNLEADLDVIVMVQTDGSPPKRTPVNTSWEMNTTSGDGITNQYSFKYFTTYFERSAYIALYDMDPGNAILNDADMLGDFAPQGVTDGAKTLDLYGVDSAHFQVTFTVTEEAAPPVSATGYALSDDVAQAASDAVTGWAATEDGKKALATSDPEDLESSFRAGLTSSYFDKLLDLVAEHTPVKAVSLGVMGNADIFAGIQGAFGYAADLKNFDDTSAIFAGGGFAEGVDAAIEGSIAFGIWLQETSDIGGIYVGAEIDIDEGLGVTAVAYGAKGDRDKLISEGGVDLSFAKMIFIGIDVGIGDGVEVDESYFFAAHLTHYPTFQLGDYDHAAMLQTITCARQDQNALAMDSVRLVWRVDDDPTDFGFPIFNDFEMADDQGDPDHTYVLGTVIQFNDSFEIDLYVNDNKIDTQFWTMSDFEGTGSMMNRVFENDDCSYSFPAKLIH